MLVKSRTLTCKETSNNWNECRSLTTNVLKAVGLRIYEELLNLFNIPNLEDRRKYLNLCTMYKIVHDHVYFPYGVFVPRVTTVH